jgi:hypothetical protein
MELISIPIELFQEKRQLLAHVEIPTILQRSIDQLKEKYSILTQTPHFHPPGGGFGRNFHGDSKSNFSNRFHKNNGDRGGNGNHSNRRAERPRIGTRELCREDMSRKDFVANMNKLSRQNYDSILRLIRTTYNSNFLSNYMDIVWDLMIRQADYQDLHIQVIEHLLQLTPMEKKPLVSKYWNDKCIDFFEHKRWIPEGDIQEALQSNSSNEEYDEFCDYIKWKKRIGASFQGWIRLMISTMIDSQYNICFHSMIESIDNAFESNSHKYLDCLFEWFLLIHKVIPIQDELFQAFYKELALKDKIESWKETVKEKKLSSAFRFKLMDILELSNNVYK